MTRPKPDLSESTAAHAGDPALVEACLAGRRGAWESLVRSYAPLVSAVARRGGVRDHEIDDATQTVFAALLTALPTLRDRQSLAKWLIVVAKRQAWRTIASRPALADVSRAEAEQLPAEQRDEADLVWERRHAVREGLAALGGRCQDLLTALFMERSTPDYNAISDRLGIAVGSIGPTRNRCLRKLMEILGSAPGRGTLWDDDELDALRAGTNSSAQRV